MGTLLIRVWLPLFILLAMGGCAERPNDQGTPAANPNNLPDLKPLEAPCLPTDQDKYVWRPARLRLLQPCVRAVGTVMEISSAEVDGDVHVHVQLDAPYQALLTEGNQHAEGYLIVEAVCQYVPPAIEALRICASDWNSYPGPFPRPGDHIWVEGRYVLDLWHHSWAELHPLYRWGISSP